MLFLLALPAAVFGQASASPAANAEQCTNCLPVDDEQLPVIDTFINPVRGLNAGVSLSGIHDSATGWATLANPSISYSFNGRFSADAGIPVYLFRLAEVSSPHPAPTADLVARRGELGDVIIGLHAQFFPAIVQYRITTSFSAPTGDQAYGLSTGRVTFDVNNHFERNFRRLTPEVELGAGDSSALVDRTVPRHYTSLGPLAHFQAGFTAFLLYGASVESDAYEQLPLGDQKIYGYSRRRKATVITGYNVNEDNGFFNTLYIPMNRHIKFSGYYSHSLRLRTDTAAIGISYVLRAPAPVDDLPIDDLFQ